MTSVIYASTAALIIGWLSANVIKKRRENRISIGDGNNEALKTAMAAQSTAAEYLPIALLLLFALEINKAPLWMVHVLGITVITSRIIHAQGLLSDNMKVRVVGMQITFFTIMCLAVVNMLYLPYGLLF